MISAFGAILLIAAGGYAGFSALEHLRTALRCAETILDASRDMRTKYSVTGHPFRSCWSDWGRGIRAFSRMQKTHPRSFGSSRFSRSGRQAFAVQRSPRRWRSRFFGWGRSSAPARSRSRHSMRWTLRSGSCAMRCAKKTVPPFGFIRRWALQRAAFLPFCFFSLYISAALWQTVGG